MGSYCQHICLKRKLNTQKVKKTCATSNKKVSQSMPVSTVTQLRIQVQNDTEGTAQ